MVILLVAHHINHLVDGIITETELGGANILGHIDRSAVGTQKEFLVETGIRKVGPHRAVILTEHNAFLQPFEHFFLTFEIGVRLIIDFVEINPHAAVCVIKPGIHPLVHHRPQPAHIGILCLPFAQHLTGLGHEGRELRGFLLGDAVALHDFLQFGLIMLVEQHIEVTDKVVPLFPSLFGRNAVAPFLPCKHGFADVDTTVVDYVGLNHAVAACLQDFSQREPEKVVTHMPQVQGFVSVR